MLLGLYILLDDDFGLPIYADPAPDDQDEELWEAATDHVSDMLDHEKRTMSVLEVGESLIGCLVFGRLGLSFVAMVTDDVPGKTVEQYLEMLSKRYMDEVDDPRRPDRDGVEDVVVDVIPPWDE